MRETERMPPARKTEATIRAGEVIQDLRLHTLRISNADKFAETIGASPRQVRAAENGEHIGKLTQQRIEDGFGWPRGSYEQLIKTGQAPPVTRAARATSMPEGDDGRPFIVRLTDGQLKALFAEIEEEKGLDTATEFLSAAMAIRRRWEAKDQTSGAESERNAG